MAAVLVIPYGEKVSLDIRSNKKVSFDVYGFDQLNVQHVLVVHDGRFPIWIAEISNFTIEARVEFPKKVTAELKKVAELEGKPEIQSVFYNTDLPLWKTVSLDTQKLFGYGRLVLGKVEGDSAVPLTLADAATRLAWTYGVSESQISVTISK